MSSLPILTLNSLLFVALRCEFRPLKFPHRSKCIPIAEGSLLPSGYKHSTDLLFPVAGMGLGGKISFLRIPKRGVEV
jgi:hypothetical protein